jgi:cytochrome c556
MLRTVLAVAAVAIGVTAVSAQSDPISVRKALMKKVGEQTKIGGAMAKGEMPYDQAKAETIFATYTDAAGKMPDLFPSDSKTGGDTTAAAKIWEDMDGFKAGFAKMSGDAKVAQSAVKDLDSFKASFGGVTKNCGACHETFRLKKS